MVLRTFLLPDAAPLNRKFVGLAVASGGLEAETHGGNSGAMVPFHVCC